MIEHWFGRKQLVWWNSSSRWRINLGACCYGGYNFQGTSHGVEIREGSRDELKQNVAVNKVFWFSFPGSDRVQKANYWAETFLNDKIVSCIARANFVKTGFVQQ